MPLGMEVGLGPGDIALGRDPTPSPKGTQPPIFGHVCCGHTAGWIKMPLVREVGLGLGHIVLDWDPAPLLQGGTAPPQFSVHVCCGQMFAHISYC